PLSFRGGAARFPRLRAGCARKSSELATTRNLSAGTAYISMRPFFLLVEGIVCSTGHPLRRYGLALRIALTGLLLALCPGVFALNPSLQISQYAHTSWTIRGGFFKGRVHSIAQTPDGYLWISTDSGLLRFDGVRFVPWQPPSGQSLPSNDVQGMVGA